MWRVEYVSRQASSASGGQLDCLRSSFIFKTVYSVYQSCWRNLGVQDFEKLGVFYLGREYDLKNKKQKEELVLYDSKDLVTHAVCVGMTGSGKTGLCISLLEEAAIDKIPA